jgi:5-oxoprolinase (ATP-hydrolysing)
MGGTSTDVSRFDSAEGGFEYQHETVKAGVRIMTPMLAVETVAAGGGSICAFDGQKLTVGPHSAGAAPGPACYGRSGPLTVTDMNVLLGRVPPAHFPFPLDVRAIHRRIDELRGEMAGAPGATPEPMELAEGFLRIADSHMASAIKRISIARAAQPDGRRAQRPRHRRRRRQGNQAADLPRDAG